MTVGDNNRQYIWRGSEREDLQKLLRLADFIFDNNLTMEGIVQGKHQSYEFITTFSGVTFYGDDELDVLFVNKERPKDQN